MAGAIGLGLVALLLAAPAARGQVPPSAGLRLTVHSAQRVAKAGDSMEVTVGLRGAGGGEAVAPKRLAIALEVRGADGQVSKWNAVIPAGERSARVQLPASPPGLLQIQAGHPELLEGGMMMRIVAPPKAAPPDPQRIKTPVPGSTAPRAVGGEADREAARPPGTGPQGGDGKRYQIKAPGAVAKPPTPALGGRLSPRAAEKRAEPPPPPTGPVEPPKRAEAAKPIVAPTRPAAPDKVGASTPPHPEAEVALAPEPPSGASGSPRVALRYSPQRTMLADGRDSATVYAFLLDEPDDKTGDIRLNLFASGGSLAPLPLVIRRGDLDAEARLASDRPGEVEVELIRALPEVQVEGERKLRIRFGAPVVALQIEARPQALPLTEEGDLVVRLLDAAGRSVATDEKRTVHLTLDEGTGEIAAKSLEIPAGQSEVRTRFRPSWPGRVAVSVAATSLLSQSARLQVELPTAALILSLLGGLLGGLLAWVRGGRSRRRWPRIPTGGVTGVIFYWALAIGLMSLLPRHAVLSPFAVLILSTVGGWLGTEVFAVLLRRLGLRGEEEVDKQKSGAKKGAPEG